MQLDDRGAVRRALAAAGCGLLGIAPASADAGDAATVGAHIQVDSALLHYAEKGRVRVDELSSLVSKSLDNGESVSITPTIDAISGASPIGAISTGTVQQIGNDVIPADTLPVKHFSDRRYAVTVNWNHPLSRATTSNIGGEASLERDYSSVGLNGSLARDFNNKLTTLSAGLSADIDKVMPSGGVVPDGFTQLTTSTTGTTTGTGTTTTPVFFQARSVTPHALASASGLPTGGSNSGSSSGGSGGQSYQYESGQYRIKRVFDANVGVTQVINRRTLMQLSYGLGLSEGYLTDPYKIISLVDGATGATVGYVTEKRPSRRVRQNVYWETVLHLRQDVVHLSYRYFWDDWGIRSQTADLHYDLELWHGWYLEPQARWYRQTAADFYTYYLISGASLPHYASADYRLARMTSYTYGLKLGVPLGRYGEFSARASYMRQTGDSHPADAIGVQQTQNLYPGLKAVIYQLGLTLNF